jgi:hypothetical protein
VGKANLASLFSFGVRWEKGFESLYGMPKKGFE